MADVFESLLVVRSSVERSSYS